MNMEIDFSPAGLMGAFIFGVIGLYVFRAGKKDVNYSLILTGVGLMVYPYFIPGVWLQWLTGFALCGVAYYTR